MRILLGLALLGSFGFALAQTQKPPYTISIAARQSPVQSGGVQPLSVKQKNVSRRTIYIQLGNDMSTRYRIEITRNGNPVAKTKEMLDLEAARRAYAACYPTCAGTISGPLGFDLKPGMEIGGDLPVSNYYDMTAPGVYQITLFYDTNTYDLTKNIPIKSNTITVTVIPADSSPPL